jgi:perosamine synthetase
MIGLKMDNNSEIQITKPVLGAEEESLVLETIRSGWLAQGKHISEFERLVAEYVGVDHAVAVSNCTVALQLILYYLDIGPGDEVVLPSFTYIASANAVESLGAKPVFCDIDLRTFNLEPSSVERAITTKTKAIMAVSLFGLAADLKALSELADQHDLHLIEDAACALGSMAFGHHTGKEAVASAFSFHPRKIITTGEGGMIVTSGGDMAAMLRVLRNHGASSSDFERETSSHGFLLGAFEVMGFNYRMTDMQGALGVAQMAKLEDIIQARRIGAERYAQLLGDVPALWLPTELASHRHTYQSYVCLMVEPDGQAPDLETFPALNQKRNQLLNEMQINGVQVRQGTHAVHTLGYYAKKYGLKPEDFPNCLMADGLSITLPLFPGITAQQQEQVAGWLRGNRDAGM